MRPSDRFDLERVERIVHEAMARPAPERAAYLDQSCADEPALRREVDSLLDHADDADRLFARSDYEWTATPHLSSIVTDADESDRVIGRYRLEERIGTGGMGDVYRAVRDDDEFTQTVAIKLIRRGLDSDEIIARFRRERQVLANLNHPNIARLLDGGTTTDDRPYLVMEHVAGRPIDAHCDARGLDLRRRIELFRAVCEAVQFAHRNLVVHRDLKPSNILVTDDAGAATPMLLDFGIAKVLDPDEAASSTELTLETGRRLTLAYASPEQVKGEPITTASDVYSLGVILYRLLTGCPPYDPAAKSRREIEQAITDQPPRRPATALAASTDPIDELSRARAADPAKLRRDLAGDLERILLTALHKEPDRRYGSVQAFADDLDRYLQGLPVSAQPDSLGYRMRKFIARHRAGVAASLLVAAALLAATVVSVTLLIETRAANRLAEQESRTAGAINAFLNTMLASVDPREAGVEVTVREVLEEASARIETELSDHEAVERGVRRTIGRSYAALGLYDDALPHLERALDLSLVLYGEDHPESAMSMNEFGVLLRSMGRYADSETLHRAALAISRIHGGDFSREAAASMNHLAQSLYDQGRFVEGRPLYLRAFEIRSQLLGAADEELIESLGNLGRERVVAGDYPRAKELYGEVLELQRALHGDTHPGTIGAMNNAAYIAMNMGQFAEAELMLRDVVAAYQAIFDGPHPDIARGLNNLGECIRQQGRLDDAVAVHREALDMRRATLGNDHALVAVSLNNLGLTLGSMQSFDEAVEIHGEALDIRRRTLGERHPDVATSVANLGQVYYKRGDCNRGRTYFAEALDIRREAYGDRHPLVANSQMNLARCLCELGELAEAETACRAALDTQVELLGPTHPHLAATQSVLGRILVRADRHEEAELMLLAAFELVRTSFGDDSPHLQGIARDIVALYESWDRPGDADAWRARLDTGGS